MSGECPKGRDCLYSAKLYELADEILRLRAELDYYTGPHAVVDHFPQHTRIRIFKNREDADERRKY